MANTTWSTTDKVAGVTLSGGNLIATATGTNQNGRAIDRQLTGKFYWELTANTIASTNTGFGIANAGAVIGTGFASTSGVNAVVVWKSSNIYVNGVGTSVNLGVIAAGNLVCFALDLDNKRFWARIGAAGNWNASAANNPATNTGGIDVSIVVGTVIPAYPVYTLGLTGDQITVNFGDTAYTGTPPAGFTAGFTSGASFPNYGIATQVAVEEWGVGTPAVWATQVAVEEWASVLTVPAAANTRAMMLA